MNSFKREQIRKILELPDHQSFSIVRWYSPAEVKPIEATYVMAKLYERGSALSVSARPMNTGDFGSFDPLKDKPLGNRSCVGLVLSSLDDRVDDFGQLQYLAASLPADK